MLEETPYTEAALCERYGIPSVYEFRKSNPAPAGAPADPLELLTRLFLESVDVDWSVVYSMLPGPAIEALQAFGFIEPDAADPRLCRATVMLYPTESLYIVSDRIVSDRVSSGAARLLPHLEPDVVYPAITPNTKRFLNILPQQPCEYFLELCAGTGIAALIAARRYARHAWACDITQRATEFAEFNRRLNGLENVTVLQGDLYQPVPGLTFDRIAAHPPYVPALRREHVFRDGGEDGEQVTRAIIADLPRYLRPGGAFYCAALGSDRKSAPLELRLREMLGPDHQEFDVLMGGLEAFSPVDYHLRLAAAGEAGVEDLEQRNAVFQSLEIERLITCAMVMRRRAQPGMPVTIRRQMGPETVNADLEWLLDWEAAAQDPAHLERVLDCRPACSTAVRLRSTHVLKDHQWTLSECSFETNRPFTLRAKAPGWSAAFVARCDGRTTVRQHFRCFVEQGSLPRESSEQDFARFVSTLISGGFLTVSAHAGWHAN
jgi:methylase of polypeptide subunit release factors